MKNWIEKSSRDEWSIRYFWCNTDCCVLNIHFVGFCQLIFCGMCALASNGRQIKKQKRDEVNIQKKERIQSNMIFWLVSVVQAKDKALLALIRSYCTLVHNLDDLIEFSWERNFCFFNRFRILVWKRIENRKAVRFRLILEKKDYIFEIRKRIKYA